MTFVAFHLLRDCQFKHLRIFRKISLFLKDGAPFDPNNTLFPEVPNITIFAYAGFRVWVLSPHPLVYVCAHTDARLCIYGPQRHWGPPPIETNQMQSCLSHNKRISGNRFYISESETERSRESETKRNETNRTNERMNIKQALCFIRFKRTRRCSRFGGYG